MAAQGRVLTDLAELYTVAPDEFVTARNALVKALKAEGDKEKAETVRVLRRPSVVDWALNVAARGHEQDAARFADAADATRRAQADAVEGGGGDELRTSMRELREASAAMVRRAEQVLREAGRPVSPGAFTARLGDVAANESLLQQLREYRLGSAAVDDDPFAGMAPPPRTTKKNAPPRPARAKPTAHRAPDDRAARDRDVAAAERAEAVAREAADRATAKVRRAAGEVDAAEERLARLRDALASARDDAAQADARLEEATRSVVAARRGRR